MNALSINEYLKEQSLLIEDRLNHLIKEKNCPEKELYEAARYALLGGGKRLRPILTIATVEMLDGNCETALTPACTIEMIHAYSLIHDDLPCMDDDDYRRGKPSLHKSYNEGHAVLTGDFLLTFAFEVLATDPFLTPEKKIALISILAKHSGGDGMIGGQVLDIGSTGIQLSLDHLKTLHKKKTGALLTGALQFGAILGNASREVTDRLTLFGEKIGLAFQVIDDVLDIAASEIKHGNAIASDIKNDKSTFVKLLGLNEAKLYAEECFSEAVEHLNSLPYDTTRLMALGQFMINRLY